MIDTERLVLRPWRDADVAPFGAICADPEVMRHLGGPQPEAEVEAAIAPHRDEQARSGHCFWAIERRGDGALLGFCGLRDGGHAGTPVLDELEIGWRLRRDAWGTAMHARRRRRRSSGAGRTPAAPASPPGPCRPTPPRGR